MNDPLIWLLVAIGGFFGTVSRFRLSEWITQHVHISFPFGTFAVNLIGCLAIGWLSAHALNDFLKWTVIIGFLGSFTTFSSIYLEVIRLFQCKKHFHAMLYVISSYLLGIVFVYLGYYM
jgi:CrcB protein